MVETEKVEREIVVPGDLLDEGNLKPGVGAFSEGGKIYASQLGIRKEKAGYVNVIPLSGRYIPRAGDKVVGKIVDISPSYWLVDINSPYPAPLHVNEVPWRVEYGDTASFLKVEDMILAKVLAVDETKRVQVTMKDPRERDLRKLRGGQIVEISHSKVPRVIGRKGSMITLIKSYTNCRMFVGQNGRIWIDGEVDDIINAIRIVKRIEEEAQVLGLTESIKSALEEMYKKGS